MASAQRTQRLVTTYLIAVLTLSTLPLGGVLAVSVLVSPEAIESGRVQLTEPCPRLVAGEPCISCGMTRSFTAMPRGRLAQAWQYNRGGPALYLATWAALVALIAVIRRLARTLAWAPDVPSAPEEP